MAQQIIEENKINNDEFAFLSNLDNYYLSNNKEAIKTSIEKAKTEIERNRVQMQLSTQEDNTKIKETINAFFQKHHSIITKHFTINENKTPSLENYLKLKEIVSDELKSKNDTLQLLTKAKNVLSSQSTSITPEEISSLISQLKSNKTIALNKQLISSLSNDLKKLSKQITISQLKKQDNDKEDDSTLILFRNLIKSSYEESISNCILEFSSIELLKELNCISSLETSNAKANELKEKYIISPSFKLFIVQLFNRSSASLSISDFKKIIALFHILYTSYYKKSEYSIDNFSSIIQMHNNIEILLVAISYRILFPQSNQNNTDENSYANIFILLKNFSSEIISQIIANFISQLTTEMYQIETFESISYQSNLRSCESMLNNTQSLIYKFFNSLKEYAIQREFVFNLNYVLSLLFDVLNRKILLVKDFSVNDIKSILNLCKKIAPKLKENLEMIAGDDSQLSAKLIGVLDQNTKYKKFEEILFVLNANLKEIRNFLIEAEFNINIDPNELIELITSIFEMNENSRKLLDFIREKLFFE